MMLSRALILCLSLVVINRGAPNIPQSYLPPPAAPPAPECRVITEEQEQEVQEEECAVTEVETCDTGTIFLLNLPYYLLLVVLFDKPVQIDPRFKLVLNQTRRPYKLTLGPYLCLNLGLNFGLNLLNF